MVDFIYEIYSLIKNDPGPDYFLNILLKEQKEYLDLKNEVICPAGHKCFIVTLKMKTIQLFKFKFKDSDGNILTKFKCEICNK